MGRVLKQDPAACNMKCCQHRLGEPPADQHIVWLGAASARNQFE